MRRKPSAKVGSEGLTHTRLAIEDELGWLFRDQPTEDYGIDAHAEIVEGEDVRGRLLALQIKGAKAGSANLVPKAGGFGLMRPMCATGRTTRCQ